MAETVVACPKCASKLMGDVAGKAVKCPKCAAAFRIGGAAKSAGPDAPKKAVRSN